MARISVISDTMVLMSVETVTGKELFALAIHSESDWRRSLFLPINCCAVPKNCWKENFLAMRKVLLPALRREDDPASLSLHDYGPPSFQLKVNT
jgi:transcriptional regulator of aromatic amino acid metabolism